MKLQSLKIIALAIVSVMFMSWGNNGHKKISGNAELSFNAEMVDFHAWVSELISHASDADIRKQWDPDEGPRHYIDIDLYEEFLNTGEIPQDIDQAIALHGYSFVYGAGVLPWATLNTYDSLVNAFERFDWESAILFAADLGHYVGDGHMPMHITKNYDGQYTGNNGIHSRYESSMINTFGSQIVYDGDDISVIEDVNRYIFDYLYFNYTYVDSVLLADDYARSVNSNTSSTAYKQALWYKTMGFTTMLFRNASHSLAELIYSAWAEAGKPYLFSGPYIFTHDLEAPVYLKQNSPNPFSVSTTITFTMAEYGKISLEVVDISGQCVATIFDGNMTKGEHSLVWQAPGLEEGMYLLVMKSDRVTETRKMLYLR